MKNKGIIFVVIGIIILIFLFSRGCSKIKNNLEEDNILKHIFEKNSEEQSLLKIMKEDEQYLKDLYIAANICEKEWVIDYRNLGKKFQMYKYGGNDKEIIQLLEIYKEYGTKIEEIAVIINQTNYDKSIVELENLKDIAMISEQKLADLYAKYY